MAEPRLPRRIWLLPTTAVVLSLLATALWWQRQLPVRLQRTAGTGHWQACLQAGRRLQALQGLEGKMRTTRNLCRRRQALALWDSGASVAALRLQQQLVRSRPSTADDAAQLQSWRRELEEQALRLYKLGDLQAAVELLAALGPGERNAGLRTALEDNWRRNRLEAERTHELVRAQRWWEALDRLNRIDHPWWQQQTQRQRQQVTAAVAALETSQEHLQHGLDHGDVIEGEALNRVVEQKLRQGLDAWSAFSAGCRSLGGTVEEDGPESFCRAGFSGEP